MRWWRPRTLGAIPLLFAAPLLCGCGIHFGGDAAQVYDMAQLAWAGGGNVTREEAAAVPYASMGVRVGSSSEVMILLAHQSGGQALWTSASHIAITTRDGRIAQTAGLRHNLGGFDSEQDMKIGRSAATFEWLADYPDIGLFGVKITCEDRPGKDETIRILGADIRTRRVDESCSAERDRLGWSFDNRYWIDPASGLVWRSIQHIHPDLDAVELEILRPPAPAPTLAAPAKAGP